MSRLEELLQTLCPDGVEYKKLGQVCKFIKGKGLSKSAKGLGDVPIILYGELYTTYGNYISNIVSHTSIDLVNSSPHVNKGDLVLPLSSTTKEAQIGKASAYMVEEPAYLGGDAILLRHKQNPGYLTYLLNGNWFETYKMKCVFGTTINHLHPSKLSNILIPLPPLPIQEEIVRILDTFSNVVTELEAEQQARVKQYEHYRNALFKANQKSEKKTLGDIGKVCMCRRIYKEQTDSSGDVPFYKIGTFGKTPDAYISKDLFDEYKSKYSYPNKGDILFSAAGTIGRTVIFDGSPAYFQDSNIVWIENDETLVLNKYLYYFYSLGNWATSEGGTIARLYNTNISKTPISVPPLKVQEEIVFILDRFDTLVNDLKSGLPAEIALRRKQYEYYRDKLLSFEPSE